ncbi:kinetochore-associated Ndc80 complex subunit spc25 [Malassezia nana]|uniref:Kinetochore protein SPC25 n=1 Tax=Malassezia nana TaxID=180528 RepID=A0AAF0EN47_9BASI|nr:kinetochore-associated Ndc80 complex subunit spc25 [Malassezia nana]
MKSEEEGAGDSKNAHASVLDFSELDSSIQSFTRRFDDYVHSTIAACEEQHIAAELQRLEDQARIKELERECEASKHAQKELWESTLFELTAGVASERDADAKLRASVQELHAQRATLLQRTVSLQSEVAEVRAQMEARSRHKQQLMERLNEQVERNAPELAQLQRLAGCVIQPSVQSGLIDIQFSLLSPADPDRSYTLSLDVSRPEYAVASCDPILPGTTIRTLVRQLNSSGDVYAFIKHVRRAMIERLRSAS